MTLSHSDNEKVLKIAVSITKGISAPIVMRMEEVGLSLDEFFSLDTVVLTDRLGLSRKKIFSFSDREEALSNARKEIEFIDRHSIRTMFITDDDYPYRLKECEDAPIILYALGDCDFNSEHFISIVGTRKATPYGVNFCNTLINDLSSSLDTATIVSGLAYGIDAVAHSASIQHNLPTVAVLAHGLNMIYPAAHRGLAEQIIKSGGALLTEYNSMQKPHRSNFLERNRIVAGLCDATIIAESDLKGGAMSTAQAAFGYNREVMALPGRISDPLSRGCNHLIRKNKAMLISSADDLIDAMNWKTNDFSIDSQQKLLFPELENEQKQIYDCLRLSMTEMSIDEICRLIKIPMPRLIPILSDMEFDGIIIKYPGNRYALAL